MSSDLTSGIDNRGEFYSHHYLDSLLAQDLKPLLKRWKDAEQDTPPVRAPYKRLNSLANAYFLARARAADAATEVDERIAAARELHALVLDALGYARHPVDVVLDDGGVLPLAHEERRGGAPVLWVIEAPFPTDEDGDGMDTEPLRAQLVDEDDDVSLPEGTWRELLDRVVFRQEPAPTWVLFLGGTEAVLTHAHKWGQGRALAFDLDDLYARRQSAAFQAMAGLLHKDALCPDEGTSLHETLEDSSHKHAFAVSTDLREGAQRAIEILGNEAVHSVRTHRPAHPDGGRWAFNRIDAEDLTRECLVYLYRLIFLFYVESRSEELGVAPMKAEAYRHGYSLESLRALETVPLTTPEAQEGFFLDQTLRQLFTLVNEGYPADARSQQLLTEGTDAFGFRMPGLRSRLFDPDTTPLLSACRFRNAALQEIIRLLSLSKEGARKGRGRISYASLGINQLGAVYEGLLSYTGFFAKEPLIEVANAKENGKPDARTYFVPAADLDRYDEAELVVRDGVRVEYPSNTFLYRLAGRDREKSASYYTPEVLTRCLVKYTLRERIGVEAGDENWVGADALLELTICEPAMGSGAFLNEVVNQLADAYLTRKQSELPDNDDPDAGPLNPIPAERYPRELQRVKARIAANQCYGVDLNPLAAELGKVSLWLNVLRPGAPAPFFDAHIATGNSLVGARRQGYRVDVLHKASKAKGPNWLEMAPEDIGTQRDPNVVHHFLLPAAGMAAFDGDKVVKGLCPDEVAAIAAWRKSLNTAWKPAEVRELRELSAVVDRLWAEHAANRAEALVACDQARPVWPAPEGVAEVDRDEEHFGAAWRRAEQANSAGRRLKAAMDAWCALWFWPVLDAELLPSRAEWLADLRAILVERPRADLETAEDAFARRWRVVNAVAGRQRFLHWGWQFPEVFERGGFDVIIGNPPWIRVEWKEAGVLSDLDPRLEIRRMSAKQTADLRSRTLAEEQSLAAYLGEFEDQGGARSFTGDDVTYPQLRGTKPNLYKAFMTTAWRLNGPLGVAGLVHPDGPFDDPKGGTLRKAAYLRLRWHLQFLNYLTLFEGVLHKLKYSFCVYGSSRGPRFHHASNLFHPRTLDASLDHDGRGEVPAIKTADGTWDLRGHRSRVVQVDEETLELFARLYDPPETPALEARLPVVHSREVLMVLRKLGSVGRTLGSMLGQIQVTQQWNETLSQQDGTIRRETATSESTADWILSGPHFHVANPLNKTPNEGCKHNQDYTVIDLMSIASDYLPRTNYLRACSREEYRRRTPKWLGKDFTSFYRWKCRAMVAPTGERTLVGALFPPLVGSIHAVIGVAFAERADVAHFSGFAASVPVDFLVKSTGAANVNTAVLERLPMPVASSEVLLRALVLNCVTSHYEELWSDLYSANFRSDTFTKPDARLPPWTHLYPNWTWNTPLRTPYARRQALVELDALAALALGLTADELCLIYRVQFPVLQQYEADTWYDQRGRIVFTNNRGLNGVGLSRQQWDELKGPAVTPLRHAGIDALPEWAVDALGPYEPPYDRCDREEDMRLAFRVFQARGVGGAD